MDNRWRGPGIAEVTLSAYADRHGARGSDGDTTCCRPKAKQIVFTVITFIILCLAVWWLIVEPVLESKRLEGLPRSERKCQR